MYSPALSSTWKTIKVNRYIHELIDEQHPDIVIISYPGGIMSLNEFENNYFGEISHILTNAVESDYGILCTYCNSHYTKQYLEYLKAICESKLGIEILQFCLSKQNWSVDAEWKKTEYFFYRDNYFEKNILAKLPFKKGDVIQGNTNELKNVTYKLIDLFSNNIEIL
jgi:hypothetical protein